MKLFFLQAFGLKKNFNPLNSLNPMIKFIELHELVDYCLASGEAVFMVLLLNNRTEEKE